MLLTTVTESMIEVMQAYVSGQPIEYRRLGELMWEALEKACEEDEDEDEEEEEED